MPAGRIAQKFFDQVTSEEICATRQQHALKAFKVLKRFAGW